MEKKTKLNYVETAPVGSIVAFRDERGKVKSAKIINRSSANRLLKLETVYKKEYIVSYDDIIWVKTNDRWPRGVYNLLKGKEDSNVGQD